ncbi:hypothetical protein VNO77_40069 [Canavalia gladiata]|uniref:Uncharacterized protein n=1 Tax=Canavalia gladiata TaxID=3824 RepID=A0AAN9JX79_CANGL
MRFTNDNSSHTWLHQLYLLVPPGAVVVLRIVDHIAVCIDQVASITCTVTLFFLTIHNRNLNLADFPAEDRQFVIIQIR